MVDQQPAKGEVPFYRERGQAVPKPIAGLFSNIRTVVIGVMLAWWYLAPYLRWDRGEGAPNQAILVDIAGRRAYFFGLEIWPQEVYYLTGLLLLAAISLFLMSSLAGRIWCGFLCWHPGFTDLFQRVERLVLGDASTRQRRAANKQSQLPRWILVYALWGVIGLLTGISFTLWFGDAFQMWPAILTGQADLSVYVFIGIIGGMCVLLAGFARERVCVYMCPYSRFQAAMLDEHSLVVTYDAPRGEPRAPLKKGECFDNRPHCIDCKLCIHACPTGVDIRFGNQLACIGCGACIDACDSMMKRLKLPTGLVRFESAHNMDAIRAGQKPQPHRLIRPRTILYASMVSVVGIVMLTLLLTRSTLDMNILHERAPLFVEMSSGEIQNAYVVKVLNMERKARQFSLNIEGIAAKISVVGQDQNVTTAQLNVAPDDVGVFRVYLAAPAQDVPRKPINLVLTDLESGVRVIKDNVFMSPDR